MARDVDDGTLSDGGMKESETLALMRDALVETWCTLRMEQMKWPETDGKVA
jgi:hypothetical protein